MPPRRSPGTLECVRGAAVLALGISLLTAGCGRVGYGSPLLAVERDGGMDAGKPAGDGGGARDAAAPADASGASPESFCGNGAVEAPEQCDDGNGDDGDGCDNDCTVSCTTAADCDDGAPCNGAETCSGSGACAAGSPLGDGTSCGADLVCRAGACATLGCGNAVVDGEEQCDDGNTVDGDGCDNDCTFSCSADADCDDANQCDGTEICDIASHTCSGGMSLSDGTTCDRDADAATRDLCIAGACLRSTCGDGYLDAEAGEECDDGDVTSGDGCSAGCTIETGGADAGAGGTDAGSSGGGPMCGSRSCDRGQKCCTGGGCFICAARSGPCPMISCEF